MNEFNFQAFIQAIANALTAAGTDVRTHRIFLHGAWTDDRYEGDAELLVIVHDGQDAGVGAAERGHASINEALIKAGFDVPFTLALVTRMNWNVQGRVAGTLAYDALENGIEIYRSPTLG
jgi:hypothetical protein